jgi:hypothetical protein
MASSRGLAMKYVNPIKKSYGPLVRKENPHLNKEEEEMVT